MNADEERAPQAGLDIDPRFSLANERTFLAWLRTALGLLAAGVGVHAFAPPSPLQKTLAIVLVLIGVTFTIGGLIRWTRVERAMRERRPVPVFGFAALLAGLFTVGGAVAIALFVLA